MRDFAPAFCCLIGKSAFAIRLEQSTTPRSIRMLPQRADNLRLFGDLAVEPDQPQCRTAGEPHALLSPDASAI